MAKLSLELSDGLDDMARMFADFVHEPRMLEPTDAMALIECCRLLRNRARELETQVSRKMWNEAAFHDRIVETGRVLEAVRKPGSNVRLFPVVPRPFSDGLQA